MNSYLRANPEAAAKWATALRLIRAGVRNPEVIRRTGIPFATYYRRLRRERAIARRPTAMP